MVAVVAQMAPVEEMAMQAVGVELLVAMHHWRDDAPALCVFDEEPQ